MKKVFTIYSIIIGIGIIFTWSFLLLSGLAQKQYSANGFLIIHVFGEYLTAITLIISGILSMRGSKIFKRINDVSAGMLIVLTLHAFNSYYYVGDGIMAGLFIIITIMTMLLLLFSILEKSNK